LIYVPLSNGTLAASKTSNSPLPSETHLTAVDEVLFEITSTLLATMNVE